MNSSPEVHARQSHVRSWSIHGREEITARYEILNTIGSGAYSDVYRARRLSDDLPVALKEIHDYQSALREIEALQLLRHVPNVVHLIEYFWQEDEDAVLVLEFLASDLASIISSGKKREGGLQVGEIKRWMMQVLQGLDACHQNGIVHRDLKPLNLLVSADGALKLADFGQSRILQDTRYTPGEKSTTYTFSDEWMALKNSQWPEAAGNQDYRAVSEDGIKDKDPIDENVSSKDGETSCVATCCTTDVDDDIFKGQEIYGSYESKEIDDSGELTSCVGTRWFRAPELLYGSTSYGHEIDLWSLGCIFAELLNPEPLFPGTSDIDQLSKIINTLGDVTEATWPGCSKLPDYGKISFKPIENPHGLETHLPNRTTMEVNIIKKLICYNPIDRVSAKQLLQDMYFTEDPLPVPLAELNVPIKTNDHRDGEEDSVGDWFGESDSDEGFAKMDFSENEKGYSIKFS